MKTILFALVTLALALAASVSFAGTIAMRDSSASGFVSAADASTLQRDASNWPFDAHVLIENAPSFQQLEDDAHAAVTGPNVVAIAIDPSHHKIVVRFGTGTGVKSGDYDAISAAGNVDFRAHNVGHGIEAILLRARASREATTALTSSSQPPVIVQHGWSTGTTVAVIVIAAAFVGLVIWLWRRSRKHDEEFTQALNENREETSDLRSRNIEEQAWAEAVQRHNRSRVGASHAEVEALTASLPRHRSSPAPVVQQTVVQQQPGSDRFVEGMLVGDMISRDRGPTIIERDREVVRESSRSSDDGGSSSSWDSGGSSSYDSSSSSSDDGGSSSSWDSGSSSSFDTGGSSDFGGGGGFDSGGGSSGW